jgi:hypothetical protein
MIIGTAGLTGRTQIVRVPDEYEEAEEPPLPGPARTNAERAMPPNCRFTQNSPHHHDCRHDCPGKQRNGGCLLDIVRAANKAGVKWRFEVDPRDHYWDYVGPDIPGTVIERGPYGQVYVSFEPGHGPADPYAVTPEPAPTFTCPFCGTENTQDPSNFHYWCAKCGKNAKAAR